MPTAPEFGRRCSPDLDADSRRTASKYSGRLYSWHSHQPAVPLPKYMKLTIEKAVMLPKKFATLTAAGVRRVTSRRGITGCELQKASTHTNAGHMTALAANKPSTVGEVQASSSPVLSENARRSVATAATRVVEPSQSTLTTGLDGRVVRT
jgi:hypothetical protein